MVNLPAKRTEPRELALVQEARRALEQAKTVHECKDIRDKAEAIRAYTKQAGECLSVQNAAAEVKIRAERKCGELLKNMDRATPGRPNGSTMEPFPLPTLDELGVDKKNSHRWQRIASVPDGDFEDFIETTKDAGKELTSAGALRVAAKQDAAAAEPREKWTAYQCLAQMRKYVETMVDRWPAGEHAVLANQLRTLANEVEHGTILREGESRDA